MPFAPRTSAVFAAPPETVRTFIGRLYQPYFRDLMTGHDPAWFDRDLFTRDFLRLVRADQKRAVDEVGSIDADPICACQDWGHFSYTILHIQQIAARRFVSVRLQNWDDVHVMTLVLVPDGRGSFVIDDLSDDVYRPSFKVWMAKALHAGPIR